MTRIFLLTVSIQRLQPNFKTDGTRKLRIFSFIPQQQRLQPNFMIHTNQTTKHTNTTRTTKTTTSTLVSPLMQSLFSYNWGNANSEVFIFAINWPISYISSITNLYCSSIPKNLYVAWWTILYISSIPTWIRYPSTTHSNRLKKQDRNFTSLAALIFLHICSNCYLLINFADT